MTAPAPAIPLVDLRRQCAAMGAEIAGAIADVVESGQFVGGPFVEEFERRFAAEVAHKRYCAGVGSGTEALQLAFEALNRRAFLRMTSRVEVIIPANTFAASAEAVCRAGFVPVFVDVCEATLQMDPVAVERAITEHTAAILVVHLFGASPDMAALAEIGRRRGVLLVEDCAQAPGARFSMRDDERFAGSVGIVSCFSFYPGKTLGALGDGGAVCTNDPELHEHVCRLRNHGGLRKHEHAIVGTTSRLDAIQARVLTAKLPRLPGWVERRAAIAAAYSRALAGCRQVRLPVAAAGDAPSWHVYQIRVPEEARDALRAFLADRGVETGMHYPAPLHLLPAFAAWEKDTACPHAEAAARATLSLPLFPELTDDEVRRVCEAVLEFFGPPPPAPPSRTP
jgi:dTDP-4-amino-4,6-dideoxygalactose transaminase